MVLRSGQNVYHDTCFVCSACKRLLKTGDKYCVIDSKLFCEQDAKAKKQQQILQVKCNDNITTETLRVQGIFAKQIYVLNMHLKSPAKPEGLPNCE